MTKPDIILRREWRAEERADGCYVIETGTELDGNITYGPMPQEYVLLLISECRDAFEAACAHHRLTMMASLC